ncbi:MAG: MFS transporter [Candidatus Lokiarchaeota archaeon]|nr:MFS transporter [Candidatus Lokiarchaeota archaeon]
MKSQKNTTFQLILSFYFCIYFCLGTIPANIDTLMTDFNDLAQFGIGIVLVSALITSTISMLVFGYFSEYLSEKFTRKKLFLATNLLWIIPYGFIGFAPTYTIFLLFIIIGATGNGAFLPIGFSIIGDLYEPEQRGVKFGSMMVGQFLGNGVGIILGGVLGWRISFAIGSILGILTLFRFMYFSTKPLRKERHVNSSEKNRYKISYNDIRELVKTKTVVGILLFVFCSGIATSVISYWAIFHLSLRLGSKSSAILLYTIAGVGALLGAVMGGMLGDILSKRSKEGRIYVSIIGVILGASLLLLFYSYPFILFGMFGYFFVFFSTGNQFALCVDVVSPNLKSTVNGLNGIMINLGGIVGNTLISSLIHGNIGMISISITVVLSIWLAGSVFWILPYFYYKKEKVAQEAVVKIPIINIVV